MTVEPNWASPPGATIARVMKMREIDAAELADAMNLSAEDFDSLLRGRHRLNKEMAAVLADNLGSTARFWLARDKDYIRELARLGQTDVMDANNWLQSMPLSSMRRFGWLPKDSRTRQAQMKDLLAFFDCDSLQNWGLRYSSGVGAVAFRTSLAFASDGMATLVWLRAGEVQLPTSAVKFDRTRFKQILPSLKRLSAFKQPSRMLERLREACLKVGVLVTTARAPEGCRASGASWFDSAGRPVIHLSFRHLSEDHFWFTFFHEAAHVLLHGENHIDGEGSETMGSDTERQEAEANAYAQTLLLPDEIREPLLARRAISAKLVVDAARAARVTAGVVVGQLERAGAIAHGKLSFLKHRYRWTSDPYVPELVEF
ncbi:ImmA/IrrE family metallo-endopeptidase [Mesorhizobium sp. M2C.T.Ca.TU.002.02.1.1]|uniref:ImmA/IrrE family metallo-endopeptidase n=1 Tax=Mesorhizobium sp. M2C.T.Ca.TU.002.02.1.1 TaxID=2496788 RepID=UPI0013E2FCCB|nr:ImmA/IrrE family metallo-endopeptidase [Mesorhizobium sp. M2C.T.Ca.TU.002.02.1.1]